MPAQRGAAGVGSRYALAGNYAAPAAASAYAPAPSLLPQAGGLSVGHPPTWQAGGHVHAAVAGSNSFATPSHSSSGIFGQGLRAHTGAPTSATSAMGGPTAALPFPSGVALAPSAQALATPLPDGPSDALRIQHTRALSTDSSGSGWQPGMQFVAAPSTLPVPHPHAHSHLSAMPFAGPKQTE